MGAVVGVQFHLQGVKFSGGGGVKGKEAVQVGVEVVSPTCLGGGVIAWVGYFSLETEGGLCVGGREGGG